MARHISLTHRSAPPPPPGAILFKGDRFNLVAQLSQALVGDLVVDALHATIAMLAAQAMREAGDRSDASARCLRHERMAVAMALAESTHHSAQRQKTARAGGEARDALHGHVPEAPLPQGRVLRHVVGHLPVPALVVPVPQMVDQLPDIEQFLRVLSPDPEQVIDVPKILPFDVLMRAVLRVTQLVEQLVEVPTIISFSSFQRTVEQHVDIPVPGGGGSKF